jgi:hypothetical protein
MAAIADVDLLYYKYTYKPNRMLHPLKYPPPSPLGSNPS